MRTTTALTLVAALALAAPAAAQNREHLLMTADIRILQQQNQELAAALAQAVQLLNENTKALNTRIDQAVEAMRKGFADQSLTLNAAAGDVRKNLAQTQDAATRLGELKEEVEALRASIPALLSRVAPPPDPSFVQDTAALQPAAPGVVGAPPAAAAPPLTVGLSPERMFRTAESDYAAGSYSAAIQGFQDFIKTFPTSPRAASAQQYIGDAEFQQNHFEQAITAYNVVIQNYSKTDQVPWAYYKRGLSQSRLQQTAAARASYETVIKQFPDSEPAILSQSLLKRMDTTPPPAPTTPPRK